MKNSVILLGLCLLLTLGTGCTGSPEESVFTDQTGSMPAWFDPYAEKVAQGYAFFDASGDGLYNVQTVYDFFTEKVDAPAFVGIICMSDEGDPGFYEITRTDEAYVLHVTVPANAFNGMTPYSFDQEYEHAALIKGAVHGYGCVLYDGEKPGWSDPGYKEKDDVYSVPVSILIESEGMGQ